MCIWVELEVMQTISGKGNWHNLKWKILDMFIFKKYHN